MTKITQFLWKVRVRLECKLPSITGLATTADANSVVNKIPYVLVYTGTEIMIKRFQKVGLNISPQLIITNLQK